MSVVEIATALFRIPSVTPNIGGTLDYIEALMAPLSPFVKRLNFMDSEDAPADNLYLRIGKNKPTLAFAGHVDVVPPGDEKNWLHPPFSAGQENGEIFARGAVDMKGGIACFLSAILELASSHPDLFEHGSISLIITGDEEGPSLHGTPQIVRWMQQQGEHIDYCLVGEPTSIETLGDVIKIGRRGSLSGTITLHGQQGHVAYPHLASNPLPVLGQLSAQLNGPLDEGNEHFQATNLEVVELGCENQSWNVIPRQGFLRFNVRFNSNWTADKLKQHIRNLVEQSIRPPFQTKVEFYPIVSDVFLTENRNLIEIVSKAVQTATGLTPKATTGGGTSDARYIKDIAPVVEFGLVGQTMHQVNERVAIKDLYSLTQVYKSIILHTFGMA